MKRVMKTNLDKHVIAYEGQSLFDFDNIIMLNWYPYRIVKFTQGAKSILELGLGHGFTTRIFSEHFSRHVVLDGSIAVIQNFKKNFPDCPAQIIETLFEKFNSDEKFDVIVLGFVLEHVDNPSKILTHYRSYLSPNGKMFVAVPNAQVLNRRLGQLAGILPDIHSQSENDILLGHKRYYTVPSLIEVIENVGYEIERMEGIYLKPFTTQQIITLNLDKKIIDALCEVGIDYPELSCGILVQLKDV
jgi:2-polyprenyl-3-methyl-5-hydroxy-6-metoxy-1,4-benzoquinol methylase